MSRKPLSLRFIITATLLGNTLEWYDFSTFGFLIPLFSKIFFPNSDAWQSLIHTMIAFFFGSISRPLGGILYGYIGDRYGRRISLLTSVLFMTIPVLLMCFLPTYLQIGIAAPIILIILRLLQGISAGGELPGAIVFLTESATPKNRGFYSSFAFFGVGLGILLGGVDFWLFVNHLSDQDFALWGWRLVFLIGAFLGLAAFAMRRKLHETSVFQKMHSSEETLRHPLRMLFKKHKTGLLQVAGLTILETFAFNLLVAFSLVYLSDILKVPFDQAVYLNLLFLIVLVVTLPFAGKFASRIGPKKLATWTVCGFLLFTLPLYMMLHLDVWRHFAIIGFALLLGSYWGCNPALYSELFPAPVRFSGVGIAYNGAIGIFGGTAPIIALNFIHWTGSTLPPAVMLMCAAAIALWTLKTINIPDPQALRKGPPQLASK